MSKDEKKENDEKNEKDEKATAPSSFEDVHLDKKQRDDAVEKAKRKRKLFGAHHGIERRMIAYGTAIVITLGGLGASWYNARSNEIRQAETTTQFGTALNFSKTNNPQMTLKRPVMSKDGKTTYLPFTIDNMQDLPSRANDYKLYVFPAYDKFAQNFKANLIMFGSTGNGCIRITGSSKLQPEALQIVLINAVKMSSSDEQNADNDANKTPNIQAIENKYDAVDFISNPGATNVKHGDIASDVSNRELYTALFADSQKDVVNKRIKRDQKAIQTDLNKAKELTVRLKDQYYKVPKAPDYTKDDWRPYNTVNRKTGMMKNGVMFGSDASNTNDDDPDVVKFASTLDNSRYGSDWMNIQDQNQQNAGTVNSNDNVGENVDPLTQWQDLQNTWNDILSKKQDIYVTQYGALYTINQQIKQQSDAASIQSDKKVTIHNAPLNQ